MTTRTIELSEPTAINCLIATRDHVTTTLSKEISLNTLTTLVLIAPVELTLVFVVSERLRAEHIKSYLARLSTMDNLRYLTIVPAPTSSIDIYIECFKVVLDSPLCRKLTNVSYILTREDPYAKSRLTELISHYRSLPVPTRLKLYSGSGLARDYFEQTFEPDLQLGLEIILSGKNDFVFPSKSVLSKVVYAFRMSEFEGGSVVDNLKLLDDLPDDKYNINYDSNPNIYHHTIELMSKDDNINSKLCDIIRGYCDEELCY